MKGIAGFFLVILINIVIIFIISNINYIITGISFIGIIQLVFVVPLCIINWKTNKQFAQGIIIGASVVFMINSLCWSMLRNI
jgi:hypothetical protein